MIKITNTPPIRPADKTARKKTGSSSSGVEFRQFVNSADEAADTHETTAPQAMSNFLFMQEISDEEVSRQKAFQHGKHTIEALEELHRDLLLGRVPEATLRRLEQTLAKKREAFTSPRLQQLLDEIELRASVELAKLEMAQR